MVKASLRKATAPSSAKVAAAVVTSQAPAAPQSLVDAATTVDAEVVNENATAGEEGVAQPSQAVATREVYRSAPVIQGDGIEGEWTGDDLKFPQLKIVQGSGPMSALFDNGTVVYGDELLLPPPSIAANAVNPSIRFVPILLKRQWREKLSQDAIDGGEQARIASSIREVEELGGTTRWVYGKDRPDNYWEDSARCIFLLEKPESSDHPGFCLELDGKQYAVAVYYPAGGSYRESAKVIVNVAQTSLLVPVMQDGKPMTSPGGHVIKRSCYWKNFWTLNFVKKPAGTFLVWRPVVKLLAKEPVGPEVAAYCAEVNAGNATAAASQE